MDKNKPFVIPKKRKVEVAQEEVAEDTSPSPSPDVPEGYEINDATPDETQQLLNDIAKKNTNKSGWSEECWKFMKASKVQMIRNRKLEQSFESYKRKNKIEQEVLEHRVVYDDDEIQDIAENGLSVENDGIIDIGDPRQGVLLYTSPALAYAGRYLYTNIPIMVMVFRTATNGKRNEIPLSSGKAPPPSKNHSSHGLMRTEFNTMKFHRYLLEHCMAGVYHYEYMPNTNNVYRYPSMILPHAVITFQLDMTNLPPLNSKKPSKINRSLPTFHIDEITPHTLIFPHKDVTAHICVPPVSKEVPFFLYDSTATPEFRSINDLRLYEELEMLRTSDCFGKILSSNAVVLTNLSIASHYILRFSEEDKSFVDRIRKYKMMLVWTRFPFTVFYLPPGDVSAEFGFPYVQNCMNLIVHRAQIGDTGVPVQERCQVQSMFFSEETPDELSKFWNKGEEYDNEIPEVDNFEDGVYEDDYEDPEADLRRARQAEEAQRRRESQTEETEASSADIDARKKEDEDVKRLLALPPEEVKVTVLHTTPVDPNLQGVIKTVTHKPRKNLVLKWTDQAELNTTPRPLVTTRFFENDASPPHHLDRDGLSFDEKRKNEEAVAQLVAEKNELFKNAMSGNNPRRNDMEAGQSPSQQMATSPANTHSNGSSPMSPFVPSPDQTQSPPNSYKQPPSNFTAKPVQPSLSALPLPSNYSMPPPPITNVRTPQIGGLAPSPQLPPMGVPPPNMMLPPTSVPPPNYQIPPPPRMLPTSVPPPNRMVPPPTLPPPGLLTPSLSKTVLPTCLVPNSGPPQDPRKVQQSNLSTSLIMPPTASTSSLTATNALPSPGAEEKGEEPMDVDEEDSFQTGRDSDSNAPVEQEEENDILVSVFTQSIQTPKPVLKPDLIPGIIANDMSNAPNIQHLINLSNKKRESQDTDLRSQPQVNFPINKPKPPATKQVVNVLGVDDDYETEVLSEKEASSSQDIDYRKFAPVASRRDSQNSFTKDRDDRLKDVDDRFQDIPVPDGSPGSESRKKQSQSMQEKLRAINKVAENKVQNTNEHLAYQAQMALTAEPKKEQTTAPRKPNNSMFPALSQSRFTSQGLVQNSTLPEPTPSEPIREQTPPRSPSPISSPQVEDYVPKTFLNTSKQQTCKIVPTESKEGYETYRGERPSSSSTKSESAKTNTRNRRDYDSVEPGTSDRKATETWANLMNNPVKQKEKSKQPSNIEYVTLDDDGEEEGELRSGESSSSTMNSSAPKKVLSSLDVPPGITTRHRPQEGSSSSFQNNRPFTNPSPSSMVFLDHTYSKQINQNRMSASNDYAEKLTGFVDKDAENLCIFIDPEINGDAFDPNCMKATDLTRLFNLLNNENMKKKPYSPRVHSKVFVHKCSSTGNLKKNNSFEHLFNINTGLVLRLPSHSCDLDPKKSCLARCAAVVTRKLEGKRAIFLTHKFDEYSQDGRMMFDNNVRVMSIQRFEQMIAEIRDT
ncbi:hypothetical protein GCK72_014881 [Caenorhabditis remanei]|uniref:Uncharacterized protein n=1 Tax=Caenorhabditis remanei TaxID=31234 RepID=A0A6A5GVD3_CAERE|nr:hypothetical protein GCK72_014881 [Caenorhabditis remanei]KAF1758423.1 hypothetical protein GCK72_014881 [Caenorhabditis remanei]